MKQSNEKFFNETYHGIFKPLLSFLKISNILNERFLAYFAVVFSLFLGVSTYILLSSESYLSGDNNLAAVLLTVEIITLFILLIFVGRHVLQLLSERKNRMAGYQLHWRLVTLFSVITIFPAIIVVAFSVFVLDFSLRGWFSDRISTAVNESVTVAEFYLEEHVQSVRGQVLAMANDINREASVLSGNRRQFDAFLTNQAGVRNLSEALVLDSTGRVLANSRFAYAITFTSLGDDFFQTAQLGDVAITKTDITNKIRAAVRLNQFVDAYLLVGRFIDPNVTGAVARTELAATEYQSLDIRQFDLKVSFALMFGMVALLLLFGATWVGLNFANAIVLPLGSVIQVAEQVRSGNLDSRVKSITSNDEISRLGKSFNNMLDEVARNRYELVDANKQLDKRREFTEAVLGGVSSGVIGIDENHVITLPNIAAISMLGLTRQEMLGKKLADVIPEFSDLISNVDKPGKRNREQNVEIKRGEKEINLLARITTETVAKRVVGYVVTFEDVSDLLAAQQKAAWSDIARRIAHEIKNPLTPIQLAAERLGAKYTPKNDVDRKNFSKYLETIIRQVDDIGRLVNEFSSFARMPAPNMASYDLKEIIESQIILFSAGQSSVEFNSNINDFESMPLFCDIGLIRQVLNNLFQNAVDAMNESSSDEVKINVFLKQNEKNTFVEICDSGPGLPLEKIDQLTNPYFTMRENGTGLGLAIVKKIIEDHSGQLIMGNATSSDPLNGAKISLVFLRNFT